MSVAARLRAIAKFMWVVALFGSGALRLAKRRARLAGNTIVLTFHRVLDDSEFECISSLRGIRVRAGAFECFAAWARRNFEILSNEDIRAGVDSKRLRMVLTFDDGWVDTYTRAYPIAARYGLPFTVFVCSGLAGKARPFWPERVRSHLRAAGHDDDEQESIIEGWKRMPEEDRRGRLTATATTVEEDDELDRLMTWEQVRQLYGSGIGIGSHTITHPILTGISAPEASNEVIGAREEIERMLGARCGAIAYPNGGTSRRPFGNWQSKRDTSSGSRPSQGIGTATRIRC